MTDLSHIEKQIEWLESPKPWHKHHPTDIATTMRQMLEVVRAANQHVKYADNGCKHISDHSWNSYQILKDALAKLSEIRNAKLEASDE